ncbi:DUF3896 family protein [Neobacillus sp. SAB-20_R2A]|uniref:DUF3896 family protein n=1 Tax=Neobacillus sp. SAB-20_R2A TaxID=3120519 RepID=UPI003C6E147D
MNYLEVKEKLEASKHNLEKRLENLQLSKEEKETLLHSIDNYNYIIELTDMNHYARG